MEIVISPTRDRRLLADYYALRERAFERELGLKGFQGGEDAWDRDGSLLIARRGDTCLGGVRLTYKGPGNRGALPIESDGFDLSSALPELLAGEWRLCQATRLAICERHRTQQLLQCFCEAVVREAQQQRCDYLLCVSGLARSRMYRRLLARTGTRFSVLTDFPIPAAPGFGNLDHYLGVGQLHIGPPAVTALAA